MFIIVYIKKSFYVCKKKIQNVHLFNKCIYKKIPIAKMIILNNCQHLIVLLPYMRIKIYEQIFQLCVIMLCLFITEYLFKKIDIQIIVLICCIFAHICVISFVIY